MKLFKATMTVCCMALMGAAVTTIARADDHNEKTVVTFSGPIEIPAVHLKGWGVLPAGTYVFKLGDVSARRDVVLVYNAEQDHLFATIFAIPQRRITPVEKSYMGFEERGAGMPSALHEWYFPGNFGGIEFVYR